MLVLLIIFMVLSPLLIQGIEVNLPKTDTTKMSISSEPLVISRKSSLAQNKGKINNAKRDIFFMMV